MRDSTHFWTSEADGSGQCVWCKRPLKMLDSRAALRAVTRSGFGVSNCFVRIAVNRDLLTAWGFSEEDALKRAGAGNVSVQSSVVFGKQMTAPGACASKPWNKFPDGLLPPVVP